MPKGFESDRPGTKLLILAVLALVSALAASALNYSLTRFFEGYPLERGKDLPLIGRLYAWFLAPQTERFTKLVATRDAPGSTDRARTRAAWKLDRFYPATEGRLLPTSFGNAVRAFEEHAYKRYGLDGIAAFPRVEMLMTPPEREPLAEAKVNVDVLLNSIVGAVLVGVTLVVDEAVHTPIPWALSWIYLLPFLLAWLLYLPLPGAAAAWGTEVRSAMDLKRLELYSRLGIRRPRSPSDERRIAQRVNLLILYGFQVPKEIWNGEGDEIKQAEAEDKTEANKAEGKTKAEVEDKTKQAEESNSDQPG